MEVYYARKKACKGDKIAWSEKAYSSNPGILYADALGWVRIGCFDLGEEQAFPLPMKFSKETFLILKAAFTLKTMQGFGASQIFPPIL